MHSRMNTSYYHCDTPHSCQVDQCIPGVPCHHYHDQCADYQCSHSQCYKHNPENMYIPDHFTPPPRMQPHITAGPMQQIPPPQCSQCEMSNHRMGHACMNQQASSMAMQQHNMPTYCCKPPNMNAMKPPGSGGRFTPDIMNLPGQPVCPMTDRGMGMPFMPRTAPGQIESQGNPMGSCRPRCMKFM